MHLCTFAPHPEFFRLASHIRVIFQYLLILFLTGFLVWFALRSLNVGEGESKWEFIRATWDKAGKGWLMLMVVLFTVSNVLRAERWRMLLQTAGHQVSLGFSFVALMIGYLVNLVIPRGGEVSRCYYIYRLNKTPVEVSFGTVVVERIADLLSLAVVLLLAFLLEFEKLYSFLENLPFQNPLQGRRPMILALWLLVIILGVIVLWKRLRRYERFQTWFSKIWNGFLAGIRSAIQLENRGMFLFHTVGIWVLYFLMSYAVFKAFEETSHLGAAAVLSIFALGTIAMAAPLPGGTGSYHVLIPAGLVWLYQLPESNAVAFTFIFHGWQTLVLIVTGLICLIAGAWIIKRSAKNDDA